MASVLAHATMQAQGRRTVTGAVLSAAGPVVGANVFLLETLDGGLSDTLGRWSFQTSRSGAATLVVKATGFEEVRRRIDLPSAAVTVRLSRVAHELATTTVVASRYAASDERGATLTALDVVTTPGTNADVMRAIQTLPGVQNVDEGTGLYVRGGDYTETHVLLNDAVLHTAFTYESPNGTFIGTVDPFLLDGIYFSSGGFGARYGNVLSGIAALNTQGLPLQASATLGAGLAALSAAGAVPISDRLGVRFAANEFNTDLLFRVNGSTVEYQTAPQGHDRSGSVIWRYRTSGELKVFGITQTTNLSSTVEEESYTGAYTLGLGAHLAAFNWRDVFGRWSPSVRVSDSRLRRSQDYGVFALATGQRYSGGGAQLDFAPTGALTLRGGVEWERHWSDLDGSIPQDEDDQKPGARSILVLSRDRGDRVGFFGEADKLIGARTRLILGARTDRSTLTGATTTDPRASTAVTLLPGMVLTAAWGEYHQVPDPVFYDDSIGQPGLPSMRATHAILGFQAGSAGQMLRVEWFDKRYRRLSQVTRDYDVVTDGTGSSRGVDVFASGQGLPGMRWRVSLSRILARRTEPNTGLLVRAPFDVSQSMTAVVNQSVSPAWHIGLTFRSATGRPFTPVVSATFDSTRNVYVPSYGAPMSLRLPRFQRVDLGLTHLRAIGPLNTVTYAGISNLGDRDNVFMYRYSQDYSQRLPVRSLFKRSYYVGLSIMSR